MEMQEKIKICKICKNKQISDEQGIICGLTGEKPAFENECPDFNPDQADTPPQIQNDAGDEELDTALKVVSFCFPIVGIILYFVHKTKNPRKASQACTAAVWGFVIGIVINIIVYIINAG
jgi:hypothetical protein